MIEELDKYKTYREIRDFHLEGSLSKTVVIFMESFAEFLELLQPRITDIGKKTVIVLNLQGTLGRGELVMSRDYVYLAPLITSGRLVITEDCEISSGMVIVMYNNSYPSRVTNTYTADNENSNIWFHNSIPRESDVRTYLSVVEEQLNKREVKLW